LIRPRAAIKGRFNRANMTGYTAVSRSRPKRKRVTGRKNVQNVRAESKDAASIGNYHKPEGEMC